jgi:hypothetical protein
MYIKEEAREDGYMQAGLQVPYCCIYVWCVIDTLREFSCTVVASSYK